MPTRVHSELQAVFPRFAASLAERPDEPYLVEQVLPPASEQDIRVLEDDLGVPLPESYKRLLRLARGFCLSGGAVQLGLEHPFFHHFQPLEELTSQQQEMVMQKSKTWPPPSEGMLCFAEYFVEADGDQVLWEVRHGLQDGEYPVYYYSHESWPPYVERIASSFDEWLNTCLDPFPPHSKGG